MTVKKWLQENLAVVDAAERFLREHGLTQVRVRHHGAIARVEVLGKDIHRLTEEGLKTEIVSYFKGLGYSYITLDLEGYRTGSMNEVLKGDDRK